MSTTLPPLPLREGALFIDNTFLEYLQGCPRACEYSQVRRRLLSGLNTAANFGTAIHLALDYRYSHYGTDLDAFTTLDCQQNQSAILAEHFATHPPAEGDWRDLNWAIEVNRQYNEKYPIEPWNLLRNAEGKTLVEMPFAVPFLAYAPGSEVYCIDSLEDVGVGHIPIIYCGKIDLPTEWDSHIFITDHKTTGELGQRVADKYAVSPQQIGYSWAWWKTTGQMPIGFCVNMIRTRPQPDKPRGGIAKWWEESFYRHKEYIQPRHFVEWETNTQAMIEEFFWHYERAYFPLRRSWCTAMGRCQYYEACLLSADQRLEILDSAAYEDNLWSPLKERNTKP